MQEFLIAFTSISFLILSLGLIYKRLKRFYLSEPIIAMAAGILLGPHALHLLDIENWGGYEKVMELACQLTLSMALMATAFRIPKSYFFKNKGLQSALILGGMIGMCTMSAVLIHFICGFPWLLSFLIGAVITPTDPVMAATIISGETAKKLLPERLRNALSFEAGANDGMALPIVLLPLLLIQKQEQAWEEWLLKPVLWETGMGLVLGLAIGYIAGKLLLKARDRNWMSETSLISFSLALGFFVLGILEMIHTNGILGVFAAAFAANLTLDTAEDIEQEKFQEAKERIFTIPIFVFFGLVIPWHDWWLLGWKAVLVVVSILLLRRIPVLFALKPFLKDISKTADLALVGWFGPIGVAALYYMVHSIQKTGLNEVWIVGSLVVFGSTIVHGFTSYPLSKLYNIKMEGGKDLNEGKR